MALLISILGFLVCMSVAFYLYGYFTADAMTPSERVEKLLYNSQHSQNNNNTSGRLVEPPTTGVILRKRVQDVGDFFSTDSWSKNAEKKLIQAGISLRSSEFAVLIIAVMLISTIILIVFSGKVTTGLIGLPIGYLIPMLIVNTKISKRRKKFNDQIADALVLISSSLRSGYSFMQAIEMVSREMQPPISEEFYRVLREINLGVTTDEAMNHMAERINSVDLDLVVTAVLIQRQIGGNLTEILDNIADTIHERVRITGHIRTLTAQGRLSGAIICLLPFAMAAVIYMLNPMYIEPLFTQPLGQFMLVAAVLNELFGIMLIRKIVDIKV